MALSNYKFIDEKLGTSTSGAIPPAATQWAPVTVYAVGAVVLSGGHVYRCTAAGTSGAGTLAAPGPSPTVLVDGTATWALVGAGSGPYVSDAAQLQELGYIGLGKDQSALGYGVAEMIYVKFTGTAVAGDLVKFDTFASTCIQSGATNGAGAGIQYGIAMGSQVAGNYGWVMVRGTHDHANVDGGAVVGNVPSGTAVAGRLGVAGGVANYVLDGIVSKNLGVAGRGTVFLYWPACSGR